MSEPHQPHTPPASNLAWIGGAGVGAGLSWIAAVIVMALTYRTHPAIGIGAFVIAGTATLVAVILSARYDVEKSNASDHAQVLADIQEDREQNLAEHAQIVVGMQKLEAKMDRLEGKLDLIAQHLPKALEDEKWKGYADGFEDKRGGDVIDFPKRA